MSGLFDSGNKGAIFDNNGIFDNKSVLDQGQNKSIFQTENVKTVDNYDAQRSAAEAAAKASYKASAEQAESLRKAKEAKAAHDAARAGSVASSIASAKQAKELRRMNEAMKAAENAKNVPAENATLTAEQIDSMFKKYADELREAAAVNQENAKQQETIYYLPNTDVQSDFKKYLIFGALGVAALYLLTNHRGSRR